jgi:hypothetical protein
MAEQGYDDATCSAYATAKCWTDALNDMHDIKVKRDVVYEAVLRMFNEAISNINPDGTVAKGDIAADGIKPDDLVYCLVQGKAFQITGKGQNKHTQTIQTVTLTLKQYAGNVPLVGGHAEFNCRRYLQDEFPRYRSFFHVYLFKDCNV